MYLHKQGVSHFLGIAQDALRKCESIIPSKTQQPSEGQRNELILIASSIRPDLVRLHRHTLDIMRYMDKEFDMLNILLNDLNTLDENGAKSLNLDPSDFADGLTRMQIYSGEIKHDYTSLNHLLELLLNSDHISREFGAGGEVAHQFQPSNFINSLVEIQKLLKNIEIKSRHAMEGSALFYERLSSGVKVLEELIGVAKEIEHNILSWKKEVL